MNRTEYRSPTKLVAAIWIAVAVGAIVVAAWILAIAVAPRLKITADARHRVEEKGQEIVNAAFPARIGAAPFRGVGPVSVRKNGDGYRAFVTLFYTNIVLDNNYMEIVLEYDGEGAYQSARIRHCNDRWASPATLIDLAHQSGL